MQKFNIQASLCGRAGWIGPHMVENPEVFLASVKAYLFQAICDHNRYSNYGKCSKFSNNFLFLFSTKMLVFRAGTQKRLVRIANREDPDQTASSKAV